MRATLLLDLDGTLVDSVPDLAASLNRLMVTRGLAPFTAAEVAAMVGDGAPALVRKAMAARSHAASDAEIDAFVADYTARSAELSRPFAGVDETLRALAASGWRLAVCTNKPQAATLALLDALGLLPWFAGIGAGDSFPVRKPDPAHLLATLAAAGGQVGAAVVVGDHRNDIQAARGAGLPCIFAAWGYGPHSLAAEADAVAQHFAEIPGLAESLLASA